MNDEESKKPLGLTGELNSSAKYEGKADIPAAQVNTGNGKAEEAAKEFEKLKAKLDDLKKKVLGKYKFTRFLSILPQQGLAAFAEDEGIPKEVEDSKPLLMMMCIPEEHYKEIGKIREEVVKLVRESKQNVWVLIKSEVDLWQYGLDSKFDLMDYVSAGYPLYDNGFLGSLRVANIHKSLILRKFEKYVASYVMVGSLVRGVADKDSDVDAIVIIDDTDVKRMPRLELKEKLRGMIYDYIREATALSGVKNRLEIQVYLLTEFWEGVKDAQPVYFTMIRDGTPLYDRGTFIPWKLLLKMGKIKPSPEAIDMFMKSGEQTEDLFKRRMIDAMIDIYWGIVTPTQALLMLTGRGPPEPKAIVDEVRKVLVEEEGVMDLKELKILEKAVKLYKSYEHGKLNEISGKEVDELKKESEGYAKKMKELREKLELKMREHTAERVHDETFGLLKQIFGSKAQGDLIKEFEEELIKKGKVQRRMLGVLKDIGELKKKAKSSKLTQADMHKVRGEGSELVGALTEYSQRKDLVALEKGVLQVLYDGGKKKAEVVLTDDGVFVVFEKGIQKVSGGKMKKSDKKELEEALSKVKDRVKGTLDSSVLKVLEKEFGDFEINF